MMHQTTHVLNQIPDYVLGLLPRQERLVVEQHTAVCPICNAQLRQESTIAPMLQSTLRAISQPSPQRLRQLMPAPPRAKWQWLQFGGWQQQLALVSLLFTLLLGGTNLYQQQNNQLPANSPLAVTATMTNEPTMTVASVDGEDEPDIQTTAVPALIIPPSSTPSPPPTPIAALMSGNPLNGSN